MVGRCREGSMWNEGSKMAREGSGQRRMAFVIKEAKTLRGAYSQTLSRYRWSTNLQTGYSVTLLKLSHSSSVRCIILIMYHLFKKLSVAHGEVRTHTVLHAIFVWPEMTMHHVLFQTGQNYYENLEYVKNYFWRENKTLKWFAILKSRAIFVQGHECLEHLLQAQHMKMGYILANLYMNCLWID